MSDHGDGPGATAAELAGIYDAMTTVVESDEPTTFTDDVLFAAATRLVRALTTKLAAAEHIRGGRPPTT